MPLHNYKCNNCEHEYEVLFLKFTDVDRDEPKETCPKCDSVDKVRLINRGTSFILKGRGWAKDKYGGSK